MAADLLDHKAGAFDRFAPDASNKLFQFSYLTCGKREDAEEVAQDTLLQVFKRLDQLRDPGSAKVLGVSHCQECLPHERRKSTFAPERELSLSDYMPSRDHTDPRAIEIADWSHLPESDLLKSELSAVLKSAIAELPEMYR